MTTSTLPDDPAGGIPLYHKILTAIVKRFVGLGGAPAALSVARRVPRLAVDDEGNVTDFDLDDPLGTLTLLIDQYGAVFGETARTLAQQAAQPVARSADNGHQPEAELLSAALNGPIRMLLVDDHVLFRDGLVSLLDSQLDMKVVGQAGTVREGLTLARTLRPDVVVMDLGLPDASGVDAIRAMVADQPAAKVLVLTVHEDDERLFGAIRAGALGYVFKNVRAS